MVYRVNEIFAGLEGEGHMVGTPCVRVRLQGCTVRCKLRAVCDQAEALDTSGGQEMSLDKIAEAVRLLAARMHGRIRWVAISGGEPTEQQIEPLIWCLQSRGYSVRVETSGMVRRLEGPVDYIRVSPKERRPDRTVQDWGMELSVVYTGFECLEEWADWGNFPMRTLQPLWKPDGSSNLQECVEVCMRQPTWQLSFQAHKAWGLP